MKRLVDAVSNSSLAYARVKRASCARHSFISFSLGQLKYLNAKGKYLKIKRSALFVNGNRQSRS